MPARGGPHRGHPHGRDPHGHPGPHPRGQGGAGRGGHGRGARPASEVLLAIARGGDLAAAGRGGRHRHPARRPRRLREGGADRRARSTPECGIPWWALAGIGRTESHHGIGRRRRGASRRQPHQADPRHPARRLGRDRGDRRRGRHADRAQGPMQFITSTWERGASTATATPSSRSRTSTTPPRRPPRTCAPAGPMRTDDDLRRGYFSYNHSRPYVDAVLDAGPTSYELPPIELPTPRRTDGVPTVAEPTLSPRALGRTLLVRQHLVERTDWSGRGDGRRTWSACRRRSPATPYLGALVAAAPVRAGRPRAAPARPRGRPHRPDAGHDPPGHGGRRLRAAAARLPGPREGAGPPLAVRTAAPRTSTSARSSTTPAPSWPSPARPRSSAQELAAALPRPRPGRPGLRLPQPPGPRAGAARGPLDPERAGHLRDRRGLAGRPSAGPSSPSTKRCSATCGPSARPPRPTSPHGRGSPDCARSSSGCDPALRTYRDDVRPGAARRAPTGPSPDEDLEVPGPVPARVRQRAALPRRPVTGARPRPAHRPVRGRRGRATDRCWSTGSCRRRGATIRAACRRWW